MDRDRLCDLSGYVVSERAADVELNVYYQATQSPSTEPPERAGIFKAG